jgi:hypothetical protein
VIKRVGGYEGVVTTEVTVEGTCTADVDIKSSLKVNI